MQRRDVVPIFLSVLMVAAAIGAAVYFWPKPPPDPGSSDVVPYLASEDFDELDTEAKSEYLERVQRANDEEDMRRLFRRSQELSPEERARLRENLGDVFIARAEERADEYLALDEEARIEYLDDLIDEMQERRARWEERQDTEDEGSAPHRDRDGRRGPSPDMVRSRLETTDPKVRAKLVQLREDLRRRMAERGIDDGFGPAPNR